MTVTKPVCPYCFEDYPCARRCTLVVVEPKGVAVGHGFALVNPTAVMLVVKGKR